MTSVLPLRFRAAIAPPPAAPVNTVLPVVTGTLNVGDTLTCTTGTWSGTPTYTYQWSHTVGGSISGATSSTYVIQAGDTGLLVFCTVTATNAGGSTSANSNTVGPLGITTYDGFAATHFMTPTHLLGSTNANVRSGYWARTDIAQLKILCPNYYGGGEAGPGATMSVTASIEYPAGTMTQILFSGSATGTAANGGTLISDYRTISIPNGERFWIRTHLVCSAGLPYIAGSAVSSDPSGTYMGYAYELSATDRTMSGVIPPNEDVAYCPAVIAPMIAPSVLILGDSIEAGVADQRDVDGSLGIIARTVGPQFGFFNTGQPGESAVSYLSNPHTQRLQLSYCTHVFVGFGINDIVASRTKSQIEADLTSIYALCSAKTVFGRTITPHTSGPWSSTGTQATLTGESVRAALNVDLRSSFHPPGGVADVGAVVETSAVWVPNKTDDGLHPNYSGYTDIATSGAINTALIGTPATPATETGSGWGDHGTKITVSTRRRANDTAFPNTAGNPSTTVRGAGSNSSSKKYFEIELLSSATLIIGLMTSATANGSALDVDIGGGSLPDSFGIANGFAQANVSGTIFTATTVGSFTNLTNAGDVWGMAVDFTNKFAYLHRNGVYFTAFGGNVGDPTSGASGTGRIASWTGTPTLYPGLTLYGFGTPIKPVRLRTVSFLYAPPSGYSAWG